MGAIGPPAGGDKPTARRQPPAAVSGRGTTPRHSSDKADPRLHRSPFGNRDQQSKSAARRTKTSGASILTIESFSHFIYQYVSEAAPLGLGEVI